MTVVGIVAEGTNDFPIVEEFLSAILPDKFQRPIMIRHLQPVADATSGKYGGGGWGRVVGWCKANNGEQIETHFTSLFDADDACDAILIQLDGDAAHVCAAHSALAPPPSPCTAEERVSSLRAMVNEWLAVPVHRQGSVIFAFPVMHSEAWLMASLQPTVQNWEGLPDCKTPFRALKTAGLPMKEYYRNQARAAAENPAVITPQSHSFSVFYEDLADL